MEKFNIRLSNMDDNQDVAKVAVLGWQQAYRNIVDANFLASMYPNDISDSRLNFFQHPRKAGYVSLVNNEIVGFCDFGPVRFVEDEYSIDESYGEIYAMYILEQYQKQGIGKALFAQACQNLKELGFNDMIIWTLLENSNAINFYRAVGGHEKNLQKTINIAGSDHPSVGFYYNLK